MKPSGRAVALLAVAILIGPILIGLSGCTSEPSEKPGDQSAAPKEARTFQKVREAAVAGSAAPNSPTKLFYPKHAETLIEKVDGLLAQADPEPVKRVRALVCPHAGYDFSGKTAAFGYKLLEGRDIDTAIVLAPSHTSTFVGASIPDVDAYETPLGTIPLSPKAAELGKIEPFVVNPDCEVRRPRWWRISPKELPPFGEDTPHTWEHSLEVQLPFLQRVLKDFELVPVVFGQDLDYEAVADALAKHLDEQTILVASSDLSHYLPYPYELVVGIDRTCCQAICSLNVNWMQRQDACGRGPILTLMHLARKKGWKAKLLDYCNSSDSIGDKSQPRVGYAAIAFYEPDGEPAAPEVSDLTRPTSFAPQQQRVLLELARGTVEQAVRYRKPPEFSLEGVEPPLLYPRGCFVTLTKGGRLRGCIGNIFPKLPLYQAVMYSAVNAAMADRRFTPVQSEELEQIEIEVSVLTLPRPLEFDSPEDLLGKLRPGVDGVVLQVGNRESTYLPQVWEEIPDKEQFLGNLAEKAGLAPSDWRSPEARVLVYQVEAFKESEM